MLTNILFFGNLLIFKRLKLTNPKFRNIACLTFLILLIGATEKAIAAEGCLIGGTMYTKFVQDVPGGFLNLGNRPQYTTPFLPVLLGACPINDQTKYALRSANQVGWPLTINCGLTNNYNSNNNGVLYSYTEIQCPLDDYIWFLIFPLGGLGFYFVYKRDEVTATNFDS